MNKYAKTKGRGKAKFVMLRYDIMDSVAWKALNNNSRCVWLQIMRRFNGNNNGQISLSCREAGELCNISKNTAAICFKDLQDKGFIKIGEYSDFKLKYKKATRWIITHEGVDKSAPTNEWRKWKPDKT